MIKAIVSDFSRVILSPQDKSYKGTLSSLRKKLEVEKPQFRIADYYEYNEELLNFFAGLKKNYTMVIFSAGTMLHNEEIQKKMSPIFQQMFSSQDFGISKTEVDAYTTLAEKMNNQPEEILFIDDAIENIDAAKKVGLQTVHFTDTNQCIEDINTVLAGHE